jgi:hypothetical protein
MQRTAKSTPSSVRQPPPFHTCMSADTRGCVRPICVTPSAGGTTPGCTACTCARTCCHTPARTHHTQPQSACGNRMHLHSTQHTRKQPTYMPTPAALPPPKKTRTCGRGRDPLLAGCVCRDHHKQRCTPLALSNGGGVARGGACHQGAGEGAGGDVADREDVRGSVEGRVHRLNPAGSNSNSRVAGTQRG